MWSTLLDEHYNWNNNLALLLGFSLFLIYFIKRWHIGKKLPPGPMGIPLLGAIPFLGDEPYKTLFHMKKKYGDIIGLYFGTRYTVILNDYTAAKEVYSNPDSNGRTNDYFKHFPELGFVVANGDAWTEQRRFCMSVTRDLGVGKRSWGELVTDEARSFVEFLRETGGKPLDVAHPIKESLISNILQFLIGRKFDKQKDADKIQMTVDLAAIALAVNAPSDIGFVVPGIRNIFKTLKIGRYGEAEEVLEKYSKFLQNEISAFDTSNSNSVLNLLSQYVEEMKRLQGIGNRNHNFTKRMLEGNMIAILIATIDTTSSVLVWLIRLMSGHKDVQSRVYKELMEVVGMDGVASYDERQKIPYTFAVLMEAQRFATIVPLSTVRNALRDINVRGMTIPKGADITVNLWALHHDPQYWEEPELFKPERFLLENGTKLLTSPRSFLPFSTGRRNCPGETIAWRQILSYFTEIIKHFEISTAYGEPANYKSQKGLVIGPEHQEICFSERH